jgi:hypothetical protein
MSLYDALIALPADKRLQQGADGTTAVIDVEVTVTGFVHGPARSDDR